MMSAPFWKAAASLYLFTSTTTCYQHQQQQHQHRSRHFGVVAHKLHRQHYFTFGSSSIAGMMMSSSSSTTTLNHNNSHGEDESSSSSIWQVTPLATSEDIALAKSLSIWPLDEYNVQLLNEVHPRNFVNPASTSTATTTAGETQQQEQNYYDLVVIGAGAGGLVSSRQAARRGAKSCMISAELAGGDCLNAGCVPSKSLLRCAKMIREIKKVVSKNKNNNNDDDDGDNEFGISLRHRRQKQQQHPPPPSSSAADAEEEDDDNIELSIDFAQIMRRMRKLRSTIAPIDGHKRGLMIGTDIYQGRGVFTSPTTIEVIPHGNSLGDVSNPKLSFRKAVIATGGSPYVPSPRNDDATSSIPGLDEAPYTTNLNLFNLPTLPPRMVILGSGIVALEMAQAFATFGSKVTILSRSSRLFSSSSSRGGGGGGGGSDESDVAARVLQRALEKEGVTFLWNVMVKEVKTLRDAPDVDDAAVVHPQHSLLPLMQISITDQDNTIDGRTSEENATQDILLECECLLLAMGRTANVQNMGLENGNVQYHPTDGVLVNDYAQSISNPNVYAVGDCVAHVPRLTHMSGEMAKVVVQNSLFNGKWKLSSLVVPAVMYTDPEYAIVRANSISLDEQGNVVRPTPTSDTNAVEQGELYFDTYKAELKHNDRAILDGTDDDGFVTIRCKRGTGEIVSCTIVSTRAGEMINEVSLAIKHGIDLEGIGRNIHSYPTLGESVMSCGLQYINSKWETM